MILPDIFFDTEGIFNRAQGKKPADSCPRNLWLSRFCSRRENQLIIVFFKLFSCFQIRNRYRLFLWMKSSNFVAYLHRYAET